MASEPLPSNNQPEPEVESKAEIVPYKPHICPYLGLQDDPSVASMLPTLAHACYARKQSYYPSLEHQMVRCLGPGHRGCSVYPDKPIEAIVRVAPQQEKAQAPGARWWFWTGSSLAFLLVAVLLVNGYVNGLFPARAASVPTQPAQPAVVALVEANSTATPVAADDVTPIPVAELVELPTPTPSNVRAAPIPRGEGQVMTLTPTRNGVGWWISDSTQPGSIGDSFLYAGWQEEQTYVSAVTFDLRRVPRGAEIRNGLIRFTGLREDRLDREVDFAWKVQLIAGNVLPELAGATYFDVSEAPASIDLFPNVATADVAQGRANEWMLDAPAREWLYRQLINGVTSVTFRIAPLANTGYSLFAWDSGHGSASGGAAPQFTLELGPAPTSPPPTPTRPFVVATLTPTPANVMTIAAQTAMAQTATDVPATSTPTPVDIATPTPTPANLETVQAIAILEGRPPVVLNTPVPANGATETAIAMYATAVALTTGTFTPVPENYVTPVLNYPSPPAENVATAAARSLAATAAAESGIPTPTRHPNAVDAIYVYATETPQNQETAIALIEEQNRNAVTTGTPTPTPWNLVVITAVPQPSPTPIPLFIPDSQLTPTPTATPTRELTSQDLAQFQNKILFLSDRSGSTETWVLDPSTGGVIGMLTDLRIHQAARERYLTLSPDGRQQAIVQGDGNLIGNTSNPVLQIKIHDLEYGTIRQITSIVNAVAYDPTWSPNGDRIAYVATESGGDEIYVIPLDTGTPQRLTFNTWEWDKHPTWSPDASQIVFYSNREAGRRQLWIMNADGSNQRNLSPSDYNDWDPVWVR